MSARETATDAEALGAQPDRGVGSPTALVRQTVEFLVCLGLCILLSRTFAAEAYVVPTGSMAPTLLGNHRELICPNCGFRFSLGVDEDGRSGRPVCPNCGLRKLDDAPALDCNGDRVLVQKLLYDVRRPRRWEVSVFHFPGDPSQAYVKRVVGLPGESVRIAGGDVYIDGKIARKSLAEQRAIRVLVFDNNFVPRDSARYPRWGFRRGRPGEHLESGWSAESSTLVHKRAEPVAETFDWAEYLHWDPDRGRYAAIHDFNGYNGGDLRGDNPVTDLMVEARIAATADVESVALRIDAGTDRFQVELPVGRSRGSLTVTRNRRNLSLNNVRGALQTVAAGDQGSRLCVSVMDRRLVAYLDGQILFDPIDYDHRAVGPGYGERPVAFGIKGGSATVRDIRIYRDVYYTSALAYSPRRPFGVEEPYQLGPDEFFVLGDNSAVSNDSRFWQRSPVVPRSLLLGKPFLVHLPGQAVPLQVFGRSFYWVPDPREIRYIR
jgi:signal peptidase I